MNHHVTRLIELLDAPQSGSPKDWESTEDQLATSLPSDYKELIDSIGGGRVEEYMYILEPDCPNKNYDLVTLTRDRHEAYEDIFEFEDKPEELLTEGSQIFPWATTDNGEWLFWRSLPGQNPDSWTVLINEARGDTWEHYEMSCTAFLEAALAGEVSSQILWDRFPLAEHNFAKFFPVE